MRLTAKFQLYSFIGRGDSYEVNHNFQIYKTTIMICMQLTHSARTLSARDNQKIQIWELCPSASLLSYGRPQIWICWLSLADRVRALWVSCMHIIMFFFINLKVMIDFIAISPTNKAIKFIKPHSYLHN